jgi:hypothetical protein
MGGGTHPQLAEPVSAHSGALGQGPRELHRLPTFRLCSHHPQSRRIIRIGSKYERWLPLLEEELGLVAKPNAKIISIGNTASKFLAQKGLHGQAGMVAHPAPMGLGRAGKAIPANKGRWDKFLLDTASKDTDQFPTKVKKTLAQQRLVFDYMIRFERIRNQEETGWVARSREWQRRLS